MYLGPLGPLPLHVYGVHPYRGEGALYVLVPTERLPKRPLWDREHWFSRAHRIIWSPRLFWSVT